MQGGEAMGWLRKNKILLEKTGILIGVYLGMKYLIPLVIPFLIAALIVVGLQPVLKWLQRKLHLKPAVSMAIFLVLAALGIGAGGYAAFRRAGAWLENLFRGNDWKNWMEQTVNDCCEGLGQLFHVEASELRMRIIGQAGYLTQSIQTDFLPEAMNSSWKLIREFGGSIASVLVAGIALILLAQDLDKIKEMGKELPVYGKAVDTLREILHSLGGYLRAQLRIMGIVMLLCVAGVWISGSTRSPILVGIAIGFLDALPVFGTGTVLLPWVLLHVIRKKYFSALALGITYAVCVLVREYLEPRLVGDRLGLLPIVVLMSVYVGVKIYGIGGILLGPLSVLLVKELWKRV
jgi:sporulation integral membrane protein YtvI